MTKSQRRFSKPGRKVLRNGRSGDPHATDPYASIAASILASRAFRDLSSHAVGVFLLLNAAYNPNSELFVSHKQAREILQAGPTSISKAFRELEAAGFIVKVREAVRPGGMGSSGRGKAAIYDLPGRNPILPNEWRQNEDPGLHGYWRVHSERLRAVLRQITTGAMKLWCHMHAVHRQADGAPQSNEARELDAAAVGLSRETLRRKAKELSESGIIQVGQSASGTRAAAYFLSDRECKPVRSRT